MSTYYDVAVIGAGPGGYVAAIRCAQLGMKTVCIDEWVDARNKPAPGGTCLNVGCIPSKALLDSSHLFESLQHDAGSHGIKAAQVSVDVEQMMARKDQLVARLSGGIAGLFRKHGVTSVCGRARLSNNHSMDVQLADGSHSQIEAAHIIIATGSVPVSIPQAPVGDSIGDNATALSYDEVPDELGVIGAGVIGLELGSVWRRLGAKVTLLEMSPDFLPAADEEIAKSALKLFRKQGLDIRLGNRVTETDNDPDYVAVTVENANGDEEELEFDKLIVAVGRKPNTEGLGLEQLGIGTDERGFIITDEQGQTSAEAIYAIGDVCAGPMLAHRASADGVAVAEYLSGLGCQPKHPWMPWIIYTWPEIAWFGATEQELREAGTEYQVGRFPFMASGRAQAMNSTEGMVKILADNRGLILGMHIFGPNASELIAIGLSAAANGHPYTHIINEIHAHPTLSEAIHEAALDIEGRAVHF